MITKLLDKAVAGERLAPDEGLALLESHDLAALGRAADAGSMLTVRPWQKSGGRSARQRSSRQNGRSPSG